MQQLDTVTFLDSDDPLLDVRSPKEFATGHIPGAINLPIFDDAERTQVGTAYKQQGRRSAVELGLRIIGPRMESLLERTKMMGDRLRIYCWRGGMRSQSMAWLQSLVGTQVHILEGGYKAYRSCLFQDFEQEAKWCVLTGATGTQKTRLLHHLTKLGEQVIDLEGLAAHPGSSYGYAVSQEQPSTEQFQNNLWCRFRQMNLQKPIWLEDESYMIGKVGLVPALYKRMQTAKHILVEMEHERRIDYLLEDYGGLDSSALVHATESIRRRLGHERCDQAIRCIDEGRIREAIELILPYYDKGYRMALKKKECQILVTSHDNGESLEIWANRLISESKVLWTR